MDSVFFPLLSVGVHVHFLSPLEIPLFLLLSSSLFSWPAQECIQSSRRAEVRIFDRWTS